MGIPEKIINIKRTLPPTVKLVAVSKFKPVEDIVEAYNSGQMDFGENRPQELKQKAEQLPKDIKWHFIGHLQTNKIKMVVPYATLIHSVDNEKLLLEIENFCQLNNFSTEVLLEMHIAAEESKQGFDHQELFTLLDQLSISEKSDSPRLKHIKIRGLMSMASFTDDESQIRREFSYLHDTFVEIKSLDYPFLDRFDQLSMGMSQDYRIALEYGTTIVRIGTSIFGSR